MAAQMASRSCSLTGQRSIRTLLAQIRLMSSSGSKVGSTCGGLIYHEQGDKDAKQVWPDLEIPSFDPYDQLRFPLPGNTGPVYVQNKQGIPIPEIVFYEPSHQQIQADVIKQFSLTAEAMEHEANSKDPNSIHNFDVELKVQDCPQLMKKDFQQLFPNRDFRADNLTVISLCQKTSNDMTSWTAGVEVEREKLIELYVETARELCSTLRNAGFWADFIDPCSGKPHIGPHTTDCMFETDERYRHLGFEIEDLGCCKVIKHHQWGTRSYVGCVFTNAPSTTPVLVELSSFVKSA